MKAYFITRFGPPEVLKIRDVPRPEPGSGEVLVRVKSIGLNFAEVFARLGYYPGIPDPPFVPGIECSGVVESVGPGVKNLKRGERVSVFSRQGSYAEYVCTRAEHIMKMPSKMPFDVGASINVTYLSAYHGLITLGNLRKGEKLLLHAAAGGVGTAAIQIAGYLGAEIFATVGSDEKMEVAKNEGADHVINYRTTDFAECVKEKNSGFGVDVILDSVGGSVFKKGWRLLNPMGRYVLFGFAAAAGKRKVGKLRAAGEMMSVPWVYPPSIVSKNVSLIGFNLYFLTHKVEYLRGVAETIMRWYSQNIVRPLIGKRFTFDEMVEAHAFLQSRKSVGKVIIEVESGQ